MKLYQIFKLLEDTLSSNGRKAWIDAHGNLYNLKEKEHSVFLLKHEKISGVTQDYKKKHDRYDKDNTEICEDFEDKGWIRLDLYTGILYATWNKQRISNAALKTFVNEVFNKSKHIVKVYIIRSSSSKEKVYDFKNQDGRSEFFKDFERWM